MYHILYFDLVHIFHRLSSRAFVHMAMAAKYLVAAISATELLTGAGIDRRIYQPSE